jgi:hypothetical protein
LNFRARIWVLIVSPEDRVQDPIRICGGLRILIVPQGDEGTLEEGAEDEGGGAFGLSLFGAAAAGEPEEDFAGGGVSCERLDDGLDVGGVAAVLEGVEVAEGGAGTLSLTAPLAFVVSSFD